MNRKINLTHPFAQAGVDIYSQKVAEGLCIRTGGKIYASDGTELKIRSWYRCQRKSVRCASSCHKCIDVRHRHSSPLSTEWLTLFIFLSFSFLQNVPVQETSRVTTADVQTFCFCVCGLKMSFSCLPVESGGDVRIYPDNRTMGNA